MFMTARRARSVVLALAALLGAGAGESSMAAAGRPSLPDSTRVVAALDAFIGHEMRQKGLPAVSIALVDDRRIMWTRSYGVAHGANGAPAAERTLYRVGAVSELVTDIAVMQLVERGKLDLDAPIGRYIGDVHPLNPYGTPITLRELMAHRAGLPRETPVGGDFADTAPPLAAAMRSLDSTRLVYAPGARAKRSPAGVALAGYVVERTQRRPFAAYVRSAVLDPLGMTHSTFARDSSVAGDVADARMWSYDGRVMRAPALETGLAPASGMYATVGDLSRFLSALLAGGRGVHGRILRSETLRAMWRPQSARRGPRRTTDFGLGFTLSSVDGHREVASDGATWGFTTRLAALPDDTLGVVVVTTLDAASAVTTRVADAALRLALAARAGRTLPALDTTVAVPAPMARALAGRYGSGATAVDLVESGGRLYLDPARGGVRTELRLLRDTLVVDDPLAYGERVLEADGNAIVVGTDTLRRLAEPEPPPVDDEQRGLIGEYGWDYRTLFILERDGRLQALVDWLFRYPLEEVSNDVYRFPAWGRYAGERIAFVRGSNGRAVRVVAGGVSFPRRPTGPEDGSQFRITPLRPPDELRAEALAAQPPHETGPFRPADLVELVKLDSTIRLDIRYATSNNFMGVPLYREARAFLQRPAAEAVVRASAWLRVRGYGLLIHDAYRPWFVTKMFWDATPDDKKIFVADPARGSRHNRGCAVDLTLYDLATGREVQMTGGYDEMTDRSYADYPGGTSRQRWLRALLRRAMEMQGFTVYEEEWWHFDYEDWREYAIGNVGFSQISGPR